MHRQSRCCGHATATDQYACSVHCRRLQYKVLLENNKLVAAQRYEYSILQLEHICATAHFGIILKDRPDVKYVRKFDIVVFQHSSIPSQTSYLKLKEEHKYDPDSYREI